jgi:hypothetical protein
VVRPSSARLRLRATRATRAQPREPIDARPRPHHMSVQQHHPPRRDQRAKSIDPPTVRRARARSQSSDRTAGPPASATVSRASVNRAGFGRSASDRVGWGRAQLKGIGSAKLPIGSSLTRAQSPVIGIRNRPIVGRSGAQNYASERRHRRAWRRARSARPCIRRSVVVTAREIGR